MPGKRMKINVRVTTYERFETMRNALYPQASQDEFVNILLDNLHKTLELEKQLEECKTVTEPLKKPRTPLFIKYGVEKP